MGSQTGLHRHWSGQKEREAKGAPETSGVGCHVWRLQPDPEGLLALLPVSLRETMARHPLQVFVGVRAMREAQAEAAARSPLASGHSTPPERLAARPGELCGPCTAQIRNLAHALWPPKFLSMFSTLFPKEQARCQCLLWPKGRPANIAQDRLTVSSIGGAPQCHLALSQQEVGLQEWLREAQEDAGGHCPSLHPLLCRLGSDSTLGTSAGLSWKEAMQNVGVWWA